MSENAPTEDEYKAAREEGIEEMAEVLQDEFAAVSRAAGRLRETSDVAKKLPDSDLLKVLAQLRLGRAMDDFTSIYLNIKDEEAEAAASLLDELEDPAGVMSSVLDGDFDEFEDDFDEFEDLDEFDDDDDGDDGDDDGDAADTEETGDASEGVGYGA